MTLNTLSLEHSQLNPILGLMLSLPPTSHALTLQNILNRRHLVYYYGSAKIPEVQSLYCMIKYSHKGSPPYFLYLFETSFESRINKGVVDPFFRASPAHKNSLLTLSPYDSRPFAFVICFNFYLNSSICQNKLHIKEQTARIRDEEGSFLSQARCRIPN